MNTQIPFFLVVMPAYNTSDRIGRAIESVLKQSFTDFRFVIVDDTSTDRTAHVAKEYQKKDSRIQVIQMQNRSFAGGCRNVAIDTLCGEKYVIFIDSDDNFSVDTAFQEIYDTIINNNFPDMVTIGFSRQVKYGKIFDKRKFTTVKEVLDANAI